MPYHATNYAKFYATLAADWFDIQTTAELRRAMRLVDYSVIESRREGLVALNNAINEACAGTDIFNLGQRFPKFQPFYTTYDTQFSRILSMYQGTLSYRPTTIAKDIKTTTNQTRTPNVNEPTQELDTQGSQDNAKRFEEANNLFQAYLNHKDSIWYQGKFERATDVTWAVGARPGLRPTGPPQPKPAHQTRPTKVKSHQQRRLHTENDSEDGDQHDGAPDPALEEEAHEDD
jgi:hypothetical protein